MSTTSGLSATSDVNNSDSCREFSNDTARDIFIIKLCFGTLGILVSLIILILIGVTKIYKQFVYRLVMYLMVVNILQGLCLLFEQLPIQVTADDRISLKNGTGWEEACKLLGFLDIVSSWNGNLVIIWTMLYMLVLSWNIYKSSNINAMNLSEERNPPKILSMKVREILGVVIVLVSPFLFCWIPFVHDMYGPSGPWCFIKSIQMDGDGCGSKSFQNWSLALMMTMFYGPLIGILLFGLVCMLAIIILLWRSSKQFYGGNRMKFYSGMKEIGIVMVYPIIYWIFCSVLIVSRIVSYAHKNRATHPYHPLWICHAVADPGRVVIPAIAFLLHPHVWKKIFAKCKWSQANDSSTYTRFDVPPEDDDIKEGIVIRPSSNGYGTALFLNS